MRFRAHVLIFSMFINTLSVGNIATEKQLLSVSSLWPRLTSTHNQYEKKKKKEPCSQIYKIRTSNKSTIWTSLFQKSDHIKYCHDICLTMRKKMGFRPMCSTANALIPHWASAELAHRQLRGRNILACVKIKWRLRYLYAAASEVGFWITFWSQVGLWKKINMP